MGAVLRVTVGGKTVTHDLERLRANGCLLYTSDAADDVAGV